MIRQVVISAMVPRWLWVAVATAAALFGFVFLVVVLAFGGMSSAVSADLRYQCDSAVGPDPAVSATTAPAEVTGARSVAAKPPPTANPYAELTAAPGDSDLSDWQRACISAMDSAPYQLPPLTTSHTGPAVECARAIAVGLVDRSISGVGATPADQAAITALVIRRASVVGLGSVCAPLTARDFGDLAAARDDVASARPPSAVGCTPVIGTQVVRLPNALAAQSLCGQRVEPAAASPGDLVFWDYRGYAPARVGIAIGARQIVTCDPVTGYVVRSGWPAEADVRVKRVLGGLS